MAKERETVRPWCPFCGMDVGRPTASPQRPLAEFPAGRCECGAVYVSDATGHNVGAAMVECLVTACNDDWDLAWELIPEEDYLTGRIEKYDEATHQVVELGNLDGRLIRGVLYFVRLHKEVAEIAARFRAKQEEAEAAERPQEAAALDLDPKRQRRRADKALVRRLVAGDEVEALAQLALDDKRTFRFLQRLLYEPDEAARNHVAWVIGRVCGLVASRKPGPVADLLHRLFEAASDSASTSWGMVETIGAIVAARPDIYGAFTRHLLNFMGDRSTQAAVIWALGEIATTRPDLVRKTPFYATFHFLGHDDPRIRGLTARLLGHIRASEAAIQLMGLGGDDAEFTWYDQGRPARATVSAMVREALARIQDREAQTAKETDRE